MGLRRRRCGIATGRYEMEPPLRPRSQGKEDTTAHSTVGREGTPRQPPAPRFLINKKHTQKTARFTRQGGPGLAGSRRASGPPQTLFILSPGCLARLPESKSVLLGVWYAAQRCCAPVDSTPYPRTSSSAAMFRHHKSTVLLRRLSSGWHT